MLRPIGGDAGPGLALLEAEAGVALPADYRAWMLQHNGGDLRPDMVMPRLDGNGVVNRVHDATHLLERWRNRAEDPFPEGYLAVAGSGNGGSVCLDLRAERYGQVWWCDDDLAEQLLRPGQKSERVMVFLSPDWATFATHL